MQEQVCEQLTFFPEGSHASRSPLPGSSEARQMTVTSGRKCAESYGNSGQLGSLVKMCLESSIWHSTRCYLTWREKVTPHKRLLYRLAVSMPHTDETGLLSWPTPVASAWAATGHRQLLRKLVDKKMMTEDEYRKLTSGNCGHINPELSEWLMGYKRAFTKLLPTPAASHYKGAILKRYIGGGTTQ